MARDISDRTEEQVTRALALSAALAQVVIEGIQNNHEGVSLTYWRGLPVADVLGKAIDAVEAAGVVDVSRGDREADTDA